MRCATLVMCALAAVGCKKAEQAAAPPVATTTTADAKRTLKMTEVPPKVGDTRTKTDDVEVSFALDVKGDKVPVQTVEHGEETIEILALDGAIATKIKVRYANLRSSQTVAGKPKDKPAVLDGKTYLVWVEGGAIKATTEAGAAVTEAELAELAQENDDLGKPDVMEQILANRTWVIGEPYVFTAGDLAALKARSHSATRPVATAMALTLESFDATQATFALTTTMTQGAAPERMSFTMKGSAHVALPSTRPTALIMSGTLEGVVKGMPATGTMTAKTAYTY